MAGRHYRSYADELNTRTFKCIVPISYFRQMPIRRPPKESIHDVQGIMYGTPVDTTVLAAPPIPMSYYNPVNPHQRESARLAIPDLVDLYIKKTFCEVVSDLDIMHILYLIDEYLIEIEQYIKDHNNTFIEFATKLIDLRQNFIYPCFKRNIVKYPILLEKYKEYNTGMSNSLLKMFSADPYSKVDYTDGVNKLRNPPYHVDDYAKKVTSVKTVKDVDGNDVIPENDDDFMDSLFVDWNKKARQS